MYLHAAVPCLTRVEKLAFYCASYSICRVRLLQLSCDIWSLFTPGIDRYPWCKCTEDKDKRDAHNNKGANAMCSQCKNRMYVNINAILRIHPHAEHNNFKSNEI